LHKIRNALAGYTAARTDGADHGPLPPRKACYLRNAPYELRFGRSPFAGSLEQLTAKPGNLRSFPGQPCQRTYFASRDHDRAYLPGRSRPSIMRRIVSVAGMLFGYVLFVRRPDRFSP
jgi:hypothetical protein